MTCAMLDLVRHPELRLRMEKIGMQRSTQFNWRKTAEKTLEVYYDVAASHSGLRRERPAPVSVSDP
jgi:glycosyltransferase involved in cell wall biosynthesis